MGRKLIVNADDLGLSPEINEGIARVIRQGIVQSVSVAANGLYFDDAVKILSHNHLSVGVHLNIIEGKPLSAPEDIRFLLNSQGQFNGRLANTLYLLFLKACCNNLSSVRNEFRLQIIRLLDCGIVVTHLDSHRHLHMFPPLFKIVVDLAVEFKIPFIRLTQENPFPPGNGLCKILLCNPCASLVKHYFSGGGISCAQRVLAFRYTGRLNMKNLANIIKYGGNGVTELIVHPYFSINDKPNSAHSLELGALMSRELKESALRKEPGLLGSFSDLV